MLSRNYFETLSDGKDPFPSKKTGISNHVLTRDLKAVISQFKCTALLFQQKRNDDLTNSLASVLQSAFK